MNTSDLQPARVVPRPLEGRRIGISISESDDLPALGLSKEIVNELTVDLARRIIALGASVVLGHNWRTGGVMEAVSRFTLSYKSQSGTAEQPLIFNYLALPDEPSLSESDRKELDSVVSIGTVRWTDCEPDIFRAFSDVSRPIEFGMHCKRMIVDLAKSQGHDIRRALDLTAMRFRLTQKCNIRLVIGGRTTGYQGFAPGIIEEAWWTALFGMKLVVCSAMGGAAGAILARNSPQAEKVMGDDSHPLAAAYLNDLYTTTPTPVFDLSVDALLTQLVR
jgi:hypothetical protein